MAMANTKRLAYTLLFSRRSVLLLILAFVLYMATYQMRIALNISKVLKHKELENRDSKNAALVFTLLPKYPVDPFHDWLNRPRSLLERDLKRLGLKAAIISANGSANAVEKIRVLFPAYGSNYPNGLYYVVMYIGKLAKAYYLDMDTGSALTWLQCDAPCRSCGNGPNGLYDGRKAREVICRHPLCAQVQQGRLFQCEENLSGRWTQCDYEIEYADGDSTMGFLMTDIITVLLSNGTRIQTGFILGCGYDQQGALVKDPAPTDGVMGLSNSELALSAQLAQTGIVNNVIGHCLGDSKSNNGGDHLFIGDALVPSSGMTWVPMMGTQIKGGIYQARVHHISHGADELDKTWAIDVVTFDTGASYTFFVPEVYNAVLSAVEAEAKRWGLVKDTKDNAMRLCWAGDILFASVSDVHQYFKTITLDFGGGRILELPPEGYLITSAQGNVCFGIVNTEEVSFEVTNIIGDISMRGYLFVYDNVRGRIGWIRKDCSNRSS